MSSQTFPWSVCSLKIRFQVTHTQTVFAFDANYIRNKTRQLCALIGVITKKFILFL